MGRKNNKLWKERTGHSLFTKCLCKPWKDGSKTDIAAGGMKRRIGDKQIKENTWVNWERIGITVSQGDPDIKEEVDQ